MSLEGKVNESTLQEYFSLLTIKGLNNNWVYRIRRIILNYLDYTHGNVSKECTLEYLKRVQATLNISSFRKIVYQVRKYLVYLGLTWAEEIKPPAEPFYCAKRVTKEDIGKTLQYFKQHTYYGQIKAIVLLGASSGLRAEELYQLNTEDIDIKSKIVNINHNPDNGQTTKTKISRISFFNEEARQALSEYLHIFKENNGLKCLFSKSHIERIFSNYPLKVKDLRKFFSQEWDRSGGPTSIKKILMGHSLRGDVDLMHYNCQSGEDLKKIYDKVGIKI